MRKKIEEIKLLKELYPREQINQNKVKEYSNYVQIDKEGNFEEVFPPIVVNQDNILIDGAHRLHAHKDAGHKEIECSVIETKDNDDLFLKAVELNAKHGYQMTQKEKKNQIVKLYHKVLKKEAKSFDVKRLKQTFSIPESTFSNWTKDLNDELEGQRLQQILKLYLKGLTQEDISNEVGLPRGTTANKILEIEGFLLKMLENSELEIPTNFQFLNEFKENCYNFQPLLYNIWNQQSYDGENQHFGKFPLTFMENLLYYYTEPFDIVFDPFAGGCTTIDACKKWLRRYVVSDLNPIELRKEEIIKHNITKGLPEQMPASTKFVFLDPPYWRQALNKYSEDKEDLGNVELEEFYDKMEQLIKNLKRRLKKDSYVAIVIQPSQWCNDKVFEDHVIKLHSFFIKCGFKEEMRYILPYSTQQYNAQMVNKAKEEKFPLVINRDLVVYKRC